MGDALGWYASIFLWLFATGIGLPPMPEEAGILYAAGVHALHEDVWWPFAWLACGLGILCADCTLYGIGRWWGPKLFEYRWVQRILSEQRRRRLENRIHEHGIKLLILARFLPPIRTGVFLISGASRYSFAKFMLADSVYCVVGVGVVFFGGTWLVDLVHRFGHTAVWFVVVPVVGYGLYRYFRYLKKREEGALPPSSVLQSPAGETPMGEPAKDPGAAGQARREAERALNG